MSLRQLAFVLTGPSMLRHGNSDALCPRGWKEIFDRSRFDLSVCYSELLVVIPLLILVLCGSVEAWSLRKLPVKRLSGWRGLGLYRLKLVGRHIHSSSQWTDALQALVAVLAALQVSTIVSVLTSGHRSVSRLAAISSGLALLSYLIAGGLHHLSHTRAKRSSSTLLFFWLFSILTDAIALRTKISLHQPFQHLPSFVLFCATLGTELAIFSAECLQPDQTSGYIRIGEQVHEKEVPYI